MYKNSLGRRYLKSREYKLAHLVASFVYKLGIRPNQISLFSIIAAIMAAVTFVWISSPYKWLLAVFFIQLRLICNMLDGMVAIEFGITSKLGDLYNEIPDRISDFIIIIGFTFSLPEISTSLILLGYTAALLSIFSAYIRVLFTSLGCKPDYTGPMAKQHRMFLVSLSCVLYFIFLFDNIIYWSLIILNIGLILTVIIRIKNGVKYINDSR